jgi:hypothetical protein
MTTVSANELEPELLAPLLLDIIQQKPLPVNHQYDAQPEKQKREAS